VTIDAHQHFWNPARGDYGWMPENDPIISRHYAPTDLADTLDSLGISQTILVQAAPSVAETNYLLGIADATPYVAKVVGWIDFEKPSQLKELQRLAAHPKFSGVRPMIQDIADDHWMLRDEVQWAYEAIIDLDLTFDCLGFPRHLDNFQTLLSRYPNMRAVIDHGMKPQLQDHSADNFEQWASGIASLAKNTSAFCKLSGLVTECDSNWSTSILKPYTDHLLQAFGAERVMWGSDWPVVRLRCEYDSWHEMAQQLTTELSSSDRQRVFSTTAAHFYRIA